MNRLIRILLRDKGTLFLPLMIMAMIISFLPFFPGELGGMGNSKESILLALVTVGAVMAVVMVRFLSGSARSSETDEIYKYEIDHLRHELKAKLAKQTSPVSENDEKKITDEIISRINSEVNASFLENLKTEVKESEYRLDIFKRRKSTLDRIYREIDALGRRGTVNLVLGVITALSGVVALSFFVLSNESTHASLSDFVMEFLPRLSIVLIIEVFSYFFLRLYKSSLSEIKYFQNEATNIEHNFVALEAAISLSDKDLIEKCILKFLMVERNPIMTEGQTTREIISETATSNSTPVSPDYLIKIIEAVRSNEKH